MNCEHLFIKGWYKIKQPRWYHKRKWFCIYCGLVSRPYDSVDRAALRPIHPHMSVVVIGYNTIEKNVEETK